MSPVALVAALGVGVGLAAIAARVCPPTPRLAGRVRPYAVVARSALGLPVATKASRATRWTRPGDDDLARRLRQSGARRVTVEQFRARQVLGACASGTLAGIASALLLHRPLVVLGAAAAGSVFGASRARARLDRAVETRAERLRLELYTVNQLLAIHVRTGAGPMQAVQRIVDRACGVVVDELSDVLMWTRSGVGEADAFRRAAELTPEPSASRTYRLLAAGVERGVDLGRGLLALSADIRDARREQLHRAAVRRRAAMLIPTVAVLAPIMLLFIAAPLPSIVLGRR